MAAHRTERALPGHRASAVVMAGLVAGSLSLPLAGLALASEEPAGTEPQAVAAQQGAETEQPGAPEAAADAQAAEGAEGAPEQAEVPDAGEQASSAQADATVTPGAAEDAAAPAAPQAAAETATDDAQVAAQVADGVEDSGVSGTCTWTLYDTGELVIAPQSGSEGTLGTWADEKDGNFPTYGSWPAPWSDDAYDITSVRFEGTVHAQTCYALFYMCGNLTSIDFTGLDTSAVTDFGSMFSSCEDLASVDVSGLDTSSAQTVAHMFDTCNALTSFDLTGMDLSSVTSMKGMFSGCGSLTSVNMAGVKLPAVTSMQALFSGCDDLASVNLAGTQTPALKDASSMFDGCKSLTSLDLSSLNAAGVTNVNGMFDSCRGLQTLDMSGIGTGSPFDESGVLYLFNNCWQLSQITLSGGFTAFATEDAASKTQLHDPDASDPSACMWRAVGSGEPGNPAGDGWATGAEMLAAHAQAGKTETYVLGKRVESTVTHTVTFDTQGGSSVAAQVIKYGDTATRPASPTRSGYTFGGWYSDRDCTQPYDFSPAVKEDVTLYAKWLSSDATVSQIYVGSDAVNLNAASPVLKVSDPSSVTADDVRVTTSDPGATYSVKLEDGKLTVTVTSADGTATKTYEVRIEKVNPDVKHTVTFISNGGTAVAAQSVADNGRAKEPIAPTRTNYGFLGWYTDDACTQPYDFETSVTGDLTLYALWSWRVPYTDAGLSDHWVNTEGWLEYVTENGLMTGFTGADAGQWKADQPVKRCDVVVTLYRMSHPGDEKTTDETWYTTDGGFPDTPTTKCYYNAAVKWAKDAGIVTGYEEGPDAGKFLPDRSVTRAELSAMLARYARVVGGVDTAAATANNFNALPDSSDLGASGWAKNDLVWATCEQLITGYREPDGTRLLLPNGTATRAELAKMLTQYCRNV